MKKDENPICALCEKEMWKNSSFKVIFECQDCGVWCSIQAFDLFFFTEIMCQVFLFLELLKNVGGKPNFFLFSEIFQFSKFIFP